GDWRVAVYDSSLNYLTRDQQRCFVDQQRGPVDIGKVALLEGAARGVQKVLYARTRLKIVESRFVNRAEHAHADSHGRGCRVWRLRYRGLSCRRHGRHLLRGLRDGQVAGGEGFRGGSGLTGATPDQDRPSEDNRGCNTEQEPLLAHGQQATLHYSPFIGF